MAVGAPNCLFASLANRSIAGSVNVGCNISKYKNVKTVRLAHAFQ